MEDKLFKDALKGLNPWVDLTVLQSGAVVPYISHGLCPNQSSNSTRYIGKIRDAMMPYVGTWHFRTIECMDKCLDLILVACMGTYYDGYFGYTLFIRFCCRF
jgi:hypothetical protein